MAIMIAEIARDLLDDSSSPSQEVEFELPSPSFVSLNLIIWRNIFRSGSRSLDGLGEAFLPSCRRLTGQSRAVQ